MRGATGRGAAVAAEFRRRYGREPDGVWAAPGRVNLIGEHTDYNDGFVLPVAIEHCAVAALGSRDDDLVRGWSVQAGPGTCSLGDLPAQPPRGWIAYVAGAAWALQELGVPVSGLDLVVDSDVPAGAGLSSSAALTCSVTLGLSDLLGAELDRMTLALAAQRAERDVVGAPVGIMDQAVSLLARAEHALFLDCRTGDTEQVPLGLAAAGLELLVMDTRVSHSHATGAYGERRRECADAAEALGKKTLRDATEPELEKLDPLLRRRARHVVTENARTLAARELLRAGRLRDLGPLLTQSHLSLRDDFEVSVPELDLAVEAAKKAGALGARMTGGGFGGSALALVPAEHADAVRNEVTGAFLRSGYGPPALFSVVPAQGAQHLKEI
ncbi:MAG TPA: galactokinase [Sporichthya sp.]|nr:galactokinase [Sporichthya sp.]